MVEIIYDALYLGLAVPLVIETQAADIGVLILHFHVIECGYLGEYLFQLGVGEYYRLVC